ncbi:hypothetical protein XELAEV_18045949mg [Xenopus laevis]|uniref:Uncharacterized protein n=1 Tax=Xenopus laevis TaxID=8355 RepID=A0A974H043_XENLA|nr:hypothetical protein XELAEV_18045949mg [Xenopus laevis]
MASPQRISKRFPGHLRFPRSSHTSHYRSYGHEGREWGTERGLTSFQPSATRTKRQMTTDLSHERSALTSLRHLGYRKEKEAGARDAGI